MLVRWPGKVKAGAVNDHISAFWDILPTCMELVGVDMPAGTDGISMVPTLLGKSTQSKHPYMYWEFHERGGKQAVRIGKWKAVRLNVKKNPDNPIELYDLSDDLGENNNIAENHPKIVEKMKSIMAEARTPNKVFKFLPAEME